MPATPVIPASVKASQVQAGQHVRVPGLTSISLLVEQVRNYTEYDADWTTLTVWTETSHGNIAQMVEITLLADTYVLAV